MNYNIEFSFKSKKFLKSLDKTVSLRIIEKINLLTENPFRYLEHYEGDYYKLRIGDYRALIDINFKEKILIIQVLDKRGRIYK
ncbi:MAG: type II toxin-antitoxin system RelE/ParE family toxin [Nanoarchaeota archaeon]